MLTSDTVLCTQRGHAMRSRSLRQGSTYQREIHSIDREIHRSRSSHPESKSGCVNDSDSTTTVNDINSAYFRLTTCQAWF